MHNVKLIRRRFPRAGGRIVLVLALASASLLLIGLGLLILG